MDSRKLKLYNELAWIWNLWGDPDGEYADNSRIIISMIEKYSRIPVTTLLDVGCGGGKFIYTLKKKYQVTGIDISPAMLKNAAKLNPDCELIQSDMRSFELDRCFDAVLIDDAIPYMTTEKDLSAVFAKACKHLKQGGVLIVTPDHTSESFINNTTQVFNSIEHPDYPDTSIVFIENNFDPDSKDTVFESTHLYLIRRKGALSIEYDVHTLGLFPETVWVSLLQSAGLTVHKEYYYEDNKQYLTFVCIKTRKL